jgi:hypothetical protein
MANDEHVAKLKQGVEAWNAWRRENPDIRPELSGADLRDWDLRIVDLSNACLIDTDKASKATARRAECFMNINSNALAHEIAPRCRGVSASVALGPYAGLRPVSETFVRRCHLGWTAGRRKAANS